MLASKKNSREYTRVRQRGVQRCCAVFGPRRRVAKGVSGRGACSAFQHSFQRGTVSRKPSRSGHVLQTKRVSSRKQRPVCCSAVLFSLHHFFLPFLPFPLCFWPMPPPPPPPPSPAFTAPGREVASPSCVYGERSHTSCCVCPLTKQWTTPTARQKQVVYHLGTITGIVGSTSS